MRVGLGNDRGFIYGGVYGGEEIQPSGLRIV